MRWLHWLLGLLIVGGLVWFGYRQYQDPRVRGLFGPTPKRRPPAAALPARDSSEDSTFSSHRRNAKQERVPQGSKRQPPQEVPPLANDTFSSTILGILAARGLASGISLSVTDDTIEARGKVDDVEKRREILNVLEKARGHRSLDSSWLVVIGSQP